MSALLEAGLQHLDYMALLLYFVAILGVTIQVNRVIGSNNSKDFFLAGGHVQWWAIGFSLFASNLGTDHLVGLAGSGAAGGIGVGNYEFSACTMLLILGWAFVPYYMAFDVYTVPEFLEKRFSHGLRNFFTWLTIVSTIVTKIAVTMFAGAVVLEELLGWNMYVSSVVLLVFTAVYTVLGGLAAVVYAEVVQSIILIVGSICLLYFGMNEVGGWEGLQKSLPESHFRLLKPLDHPDFPWLGVLFGMPIVSIWYWCTDQVMVQRVLAADCPKAAQEGCLFAGWLKLLPMYIMVLPGLIAAALFPKETEENSNAAFALLVSRILPPGWVGIMVAVMLSSFMASLASCFNSCSTLFTMDIYKEFRPEADEAQLVLAGRVFTALTALMSIAWLPMIEYGHDQLFIYIQSMQVIWAPPIAVMFIGARFLPDMHSFEAWVTLMFGVFIGIVFWVLTNLVPHDKLNGVGLGWIADFNILHFAILSFCLSFIVLGTCLAWSRVLYSKSEQQRLLGTHVLDNISNQNWAGPTAQILAVCLVIAVQGLTIFHSVWP